MNSSLKSQARKGFTLVEMIGVLAIIAVLAVVIAPKVFNAIRTSRINSTLVSIDAFKTIAADFVGKHGTLPVTTANSRIDDLFIDAGLAEERFAAKIGIQADVYAIAGAAWTRGTDGLWTASGGSSQASTNRIICLTSSNKTPNTAAGANYQLDGSKDIASGSRIISAVLESVSEAEARELSESVDGIGLSTTSGADAKGKVVYNTPNKGLVDVYIYMMHQ